MPNHLAFVCVMADGADPAQAEALPPANPRGQHSTSTSGRSAASRSWPSSPAWALPSPPRASSACWTPSRSSGWSWSGSPGAVDDETPIGTLVLPERVVNSATGAEYRPDRRRRESRTGRCGRPTELTTDLDLLASSEPRGRVAGHGNGRHRRELRASGDPLVGLPGHQRPGHRREYRRGGVPTQQSGREPEPRVDRRLPPQASESNPCPRPLGQGCAAGDHMRCVGGDPSGDRTPRGCGTAGVTRRPLTTGLRLLGAGLPSGARAAGGLTACLVGAAVRRDPGPPSLSLDRPGGHRVVIAAFAVGSDSSVWSPHSARWPRSRSLDARNDDRRSGRPLGNRARHRIGDHPPGLARRGSPRRTRRSVRSSDDAARHGRHRARDHRSGSRQPELLWFVVIFALGRPFLSVTTRSPRCSPPSKPEQPTGPRRWRSWPPGTGSGPESLHSSASRRAASGSGGSSPWRCSAVPPTGHRPTGHRIGSLRRGRSRQGAPPPGYRGGRPAVPGTALGPRPPRVRDLGDHRPGQHVRLPLRRERPPPVGPPDRSHGGGRRRHGTGRAAHRPLVGGQYRQASHWGGRHGGHRRVRGDGLQRVTGRSRRRLLPRCARRGRSSRPCIGSLLTELFPTSVRASVAGWWLVAGVFGAAAGRSSSEPSPTSAIASAWPRWPRSCRHASLRACSGASPRRGEPNPRSSGLNREPPRAACLRCRRRGGAGHPRVVHPAVHGARRHRRPPRNCRDRRVRVARPPDRSGGYGDHRWPCGHRGTVGRRLGAALGALGRRDRRRGRVGTVLLLLVPSPGPSHGELDARRGRRVPSLARTRLRGAAPARLAPGRAMTWRDVTWAVWSAIALVLVAVRGRRDRLARGRLPRADDLLRMMTASPTRRTLLVLGWLWLGWHTFAR